MSDPKVDIYTALSAVMGDVQGIAKKDRNTQQNFNFRGIDAVMSAVGPALRKHGVIAVPVHVEDLTRETYTTAKGTAMSNVSLRITWRFYGPDGSSIDAMSYGEAADAGDKAISKAHSVAYRTVLLQALCIPTDEPDPDASSHERAAQQPGEAARAHGVVRAASPSKPTASQVRGQIAAIGADRHLTPQEIADDFASWSMGTAIGAAKVEDLLAYVDHIQST